MPSLPESNCLLTEFEGTFVSRLLGSRTWHIKLAAAAFLGAIITVVLGHLARANGLNLQVLASIRTNSGWVTLSPFDVIHGYLAETNHAFFYLLLAPAYIIAGGAFIWSANHALAQLEIQGRIRGRQFATGVLAEVGRRNARLFKWLVIVLPLVMIGKEVAVEVESYCAVSRGVRDDLGYVQAPFLDDWVDRFNHQPHETDRYRIFHPLAGMEFQEKVKSALQSATPATWARWASAKALVPTAFPNPAAIGELLGGEVQKGAFRVDLDQAAAAGLFSLKTGRCIGASKDRTGWHWLFLSCVFLLEGMFHAFVVWTLLKALFWLGIVKKMLPGSREWGFEFRPLMQDPRKHFGLYDLHKPYNFILVFVLVGAFVLALAFASNSAKEIGFDAGAETRAYLGTLLIAVTVIVPAIAIFCGPMLYFDSRMANLQARLVGRLEAKLARCRDRKRILEIEAEKAAICAQTCWPRENKQFKFLVLAILIFVAMPVLLSMHQVPKQAETYLSVVRHSQVVMHALADRLYHLTAP
jgi:hypothetical protein